MISHLRDNERCNSCHQCGQKSGAYTERTRKLGELSFSLMAKEVLMLQFCNLFSGFSMTPLRFNFRV
jgi:hypothetical protein